MRIYIAYLLSVIYFGLSILHLYWATRNNPSFGATLPTTTSGEYLFKPRRLDCIIVGLGLMSFGLLYILQAQTNLILAPWIVTVGGWLVACLFILRGIGDFRYVGFFKKVKGTSFAKADTMIYSPLCLLLGGLGLYIQLG